MARCRSRAVHIDSSAVSAESVVFGTSPSSIGGVVAPSISGDGIRARRRCPGNGIVSAAPKMTTMTAMRTRLASETVKIDQCRYRPGVFKLGSPDPSVGAMSC